MHGSASVQIDSEQDQVVPTFCRLNSFKSELESVIKRIDDLIKQSDERTEVSSDLLIKNRVRMSFAEALDGVRVDTETNKQILIFKHAKSLLSVFRSSLLVQFAMIVYRPTHDDIKNNIHQQITELEELSKLLIQMIDTNGQSCDLNHIKKQLLADEVLSFLWEELKMVNSVIGDMFKGKVFKQIFSYICDTKLYLQKCHNRLNNIIYCEDKVQTSSIVCSIESCKKPLFAYLVDNPNEYFCLSCSAVIISGNNDDQSRPPYCKRIKNF